MKLERIPVLDVKTVTEPSAWSTWDTTEAKILVLGVGNLLMGDEGVGVHAIRILEMEAPVPSVRLLDGGTGGAGLLANFNTLDAVILIDATRDGTAAGTISYRYRRWAEVRDLPQGLGAHDFGVKELFAGAAFLGVLPSIHLFTIAVEVIKPMSFELSPAVNQSMLAVAGAVKNLIAHAQLP